MAEQTRTAFIQAVSNVSPELKTRLLKLPDSVKDEICDIRLRLSKPVIMTTRLEKLYLKTDGTCSKIKDGQEFICTPQIITDTFNRFCCYSVHSHLNRLVRGYITISGGHRVAVAGTAVVNSSGEVTSLKDISTVCIRIAREKIGCSDELFRKIIKNGQAESFVLAGPPCSGKTTLLRDLARNFSDNMYTVSVADERQELACVNNGLCTMNLGDNTDVLDCFPKKDAIEIAVRTLSAQVIVVDEICTQTEIEAIRSGVNSGVKFVVSVHASDFDEVVTRQQIISLINTYSFNKLVLLKRDGGYEIYNTGELYDEIIRRRADMVELYSDRDYSCSTA